MFHQKKQRTFILHDEENPIRFGLVPNGGVSSDSYWNLRGRELAELKMIESFELEDMQRWLDSGDRFREVLEGIELPDEYIAMNISDGWFWYSGSCLGVASVGADW